MTNYLLAQAEIEWRQGEPYSNRHQDIYWSRGASENSLSTSTSRLSTSRLSTSRLSTSRGAAIDEKLHVFAHQHSLEQRGRVADHFTIVETGFGFGINFLLTANQWLEMGHRGRLHYVAIENNPVKPEDLIRQLESMNLKFSDWLIAHYPLPFRTRFTFWLQDTIRLSLVFEDASSALVNLTGNIDAWFLDGFKPSSNSDLWNSKLYRQMMRLSKPGATLSTYTVSGAVRRELGYAGFKLEKVAGFGNKAEILIGSKPGAWVPSMDAKPRVAIIGAGIAGISCHRALQRRGIEARLIGSAEVPASSAIPALAIYPQLGLRPESRHQFSIAANAYVQHDNPQFTALPVEWRGTGPALSRMEKIAEQMPDTFMAAGAGSVTYARAGYTQVSASKEIEEQHIWKLNRKQNQWALLNNAGETVTKVDIVIVAAGMQSANLIEVPLSPVRGQALTVSLDRHIPQLLTGAITLIPLGGEKYLLGSTFQRDLLDEHARDADSAMLLGLLADQFPGVGVTVHAAHVGFRATTRDRLPIVGPIPDRGALLDHCLNNRSTAFAQYQPGLYACTGFGSHAATHTSLCAEYLASLICEEPLPLPHTQTRILAAERFQLRDSR